MSPDNDEILRVHCNSCGQETRHLVVSKREQPGSESIELGFDRWATIEWDTTYYMLECCGCQEVTVKRTYWFSESPDDVDVSYFPPRLARRKPTWLDRASD